MAAEQGRDQYRVRFRSLVLVAATDHRTLARIRVLLRPSRAVLLNWTVLRGSVGGRQEFPIRHQQTQITTTIPLLLEKVYRDATFSQRRGFCTSEDTTKW